MTTCLRCCELKATSPANVLCPGCKAVIDEKWPDGNTPVEEAEPWMTALATSNFRLASAEFEALYEACLDHFRTHEHAECPGYCCGPIATETVGDYNTNSLRMILMAAVRFVADELWRNERVP